MNEELMKAKQLQEEKAQADYEARLRAYLQKLVVPPSSANFAGVVGLENAKRALEDAFILPLEYPKHPDLKYSKAKRSILLKGEEGRLSLI